MSVARKTVLEQALTINKLILHAFQEALEIKKAKEIERQIAETEKRIYNHNEVENV